MMVVANQEKKTDKHPNKHNPTNKENKTNKHPNKQNPTN
jgi:hypothetical protein